MKVTVQGNFSKINGTHLQGYVNTTFDRLVELFGEGIGGGDKTTQEWIMEFDDGVVATVYDWKEYSTPLGNYDWHVGGHDRRAVDHVMQALAGKCQVKILA